MICNETPKIGKCFICPKHCECEVESETFTTDDFEKYRNRLNSSTTKGDRKYIRTDYKPRYASVSTN